jgi:hypothetical protein
MKLLSFNHKQVIKLTTVYCYKKKHCVDCIYGDALDNCALGDIEHCSITILPKYGEIFNGPIEDIETDSPKGKGSH